MAQATLSAAPPRTIQTDVPARLDRLPWGRFHWLVLFTLGITWILDGLEVTLMGAISGILRHPDTLAFTSDEIGFIGTSYVAERKSLEEIALPLSSDD
ncbi:MAG TPA: hypothetical protein VNH11_11385 [Pirellulales bacterium]|nr:hypothetical protein [Pirellulales bacterium]